MEEGDLAAGKEPRRPSALDRLRGRDRPVAEAAPLQDLGPARERDIAGNTVNALGTLTVDFADGAQPTVPAVADPYQESWDLDYSEYLTLLLSVKRAAWLSGSFGS
jgi:hypothetical protein